MHSDVSSQVSGSSAITPLVEFRGVSKMYGQVNGLNNLTVSIGPGITGLLGPNGAGKSTFLQLATGQLRPSQGQVLVLGEEVWNRPSLNARLGLCPEQDAFYEWMTGFEFVRTCARLHGMSRGDARDAGEKAMEQVDLTHAMHRAIRGYSKGMRQRTKIAQALIHDPQVLFLDEPMTGTDPVARRDMMDIIVGLANQGKSIIVSSHVLHEVQSITQQIVLINRGRLVAQGEIRHIRDLIDQHPHRIVLMSAQARELAAKLVHFDDVQGVQVLPQSGGIRVETQSPDRFYDRLPQLAATLPIREVYSDDDNLEAVFKYLVQS